MGAGAGTFTGVLAGVCAGAPAGALAGALAGVREGAPAGDEVIGARVGPAELEGGIVNGAGTLTGVDGATAALGFSRLNVSGTHFPRSSSYSNSNR